MRLWYSPAPTATRGTADLQEPRDQPSPLPGLGAKIHFHGLCATSGGFRPENG